MLTIGFDVLQRMTVACVLDEHGMTALMPTFSSAVLTIGQLRNPQIKHAAPLPIIVKNRNVTAESAHSKVQTSSATLITVMASAAKNDNANAAIAKTTCASDNSLFGPGLFMCSSCSSCAN